MHTRWRSTYTYMPVKTKGRDALVDKRDSKGDSATVKPWLAMTTVTLRRRLANWMTKQLVTCWMGMKCLRNTRTGKWPLQLGNNKVDWSGCKVCLLIRSALLIGCVLVRLLPSKSVRLDKKPRSARQLMTTARGRFDSVPNRIFARAT